MRRGVLTLVMLAVILPALVVARPAAARDALALAPCACCHARVRTRPAAPPQTTLRAQCCALVPVGHLAPRPEVQSAPGVELPAVAVTVAPAPAPAVRVAPPPALGPPAVPRSLFSTRCALLL